ncbi:FAD/NAD(P)-binding protein [Hymenobacter endophyticus]|uniref:FAD/NAD(P)-binding protein n=1 Tax=Hymenobacter endophyticus TaxID=3076335 RepID=A0ABU3TII8_9BACT|nr:FAD/NAD(P)-binding protein [Hymenobacter endophyticus]MDU0371191.1 FAD/NAD(P)-binding protein [Hymenobacter endophyticus]
MQRKIITIIGGGFSGSMLAVQLARLSGDLPYYCDVHLVEPRPVPGPGLAYTARRPEYLLNVRSQFLSAFPDQPNHFQNWLQLTSPEACEQGFCSRQSYGRYMQQLVSQVLEWPSLNGFRFTWHNQTAQAVAVAADGQGATVRLHNGLELFSSYVVLALGNFPPPVPISHSLDYLKHPNYHGNPWAQGALRTIGPTDSIVLIGTGLTAVDVLLGLRADGHQGTITAISRHGRWPAAHQFQPLPYPDFYATDLAACSTVLEVLRVVRRHVRAAQSQGIDWRTVLDSLRPYLGRIWASWALPEQARFLRHLAGIWSVLRHRSPPQNALVVEEMHQTGQVRSAIGRVKNIVPTTQGLQVTVQKGQQPPSVLSAQHVITCTGPLLDYRRIQEPVVATLREHGHLLSDPLGLGIQTDEHGALISTNGQASEVLFTIGPSRRPAYFESTAVPELREQAVALAQELGQRLRSR